MAVPHFSIRFQDGSRNPKLVPGAGNKMNGDQQIEA